MPYLVQPALEAGIGGGAKTGPGHDQFLQRGKIRQVRGEFPLQLGVVAQVEPAQAYHVSSQRGRQAARKPVVQEPQEPQSLEPGKLGWDRP